VLRKLPNLELLPVTLLDHAKKRRPEKYFLLNPLAKRCLVIDKCFPKWKTVGESAVDVSALVIDPARTDGAPMFRTDYLVRPPLVVTKALAKRLARFTGIKLGYLPR
jgi:hypothetical protein